MELKRADVNLLAGRALHRSMHPFVPEELGAGFRLDDALREDTLSAYARLYLKEEVQAEALVRNLPGFARFLPLAALFHAQALNVSNIAREAAVSRTTVAGYLEILEETLLCFRIPAYDAKLRLRERKLPKWYWCDPGIVRAMKRAKGEPAVEEKGALFEGLVAQLLRAYGDYRRLCDEIRYWAAAGQPGTEVDFLLLRGSDLLAVEAKAGAAFHQGWCRGLRAVAELKGLKRRIVVYPRGPVLRTEDGIDVLPLDHFAGLLAADRLFPWER